MEIHGINSYKNKTSFGGDPILLDVFFENQFDWIVTNDDFVLNLVARELCFMSIICAITSFLIAHCGSLPKYVSTRILVILFACSDSHMCMIVLDIHWFTHQLSCQLHFISRDLDFRDLEGCYGLYCTFPISNLTPEPDSNFHIPHFPE